MMLFVQKYHRFDVIRISEGESERRYGTTKTHPCSMAMKRVDWHQGFS